MSFSNHTRAHWPAGEMPGPGRVALTKTGNQWLVDQSVIYSPALGAGDGLGYAGDGFPHTGIIGLELKGVWR